MREISYIFAFFGAILLLAAAGAWWKVVREPEQDSTGAPVGIDAYSVRSAARATAIAFCLSGIAAILAVIDWFLR